MSSAAPARFMFDLDLGRAPRNSRAVDSDEVDAMLARARQEGFEDGLAQGRATSEAEAGEKLAKAAEKLAGDAAAAARALDARQARDREDAVRLAAAIARKLAAHLIARQPARELAALLEECMGALGHAPHLVVRCHPDLCDAVRDIAQARMDLAGFSGRLVVMGDPDISLGDGRLEWVDGGLVRDINAISRDVDARIAAYLAASSPTPATGD
ncbi:FliH/SctL family protein [Pelagibacterium montanilacus]|uniref:FliH/SctL family protein n=1 Tax=Pelagibacterium montanilacus TaxID=2185280 RepID=UPI000F8DB8EF|nr:FliH/SctL family protein [Pelagibacterium montanilacus]